MCVCMCVGMCSFECVSVCVCVCVTGSADDHKRKKMLLSRVANYCT
jgi:hypothetical protein